MALRAVDAALWTFNGMMPDERPGKFHLPEGEILRHFRETGNQSMFTDAWFIPDVCKTPVAIWQGLERSGQDESLCYSGFPSGDFAAYRGHDDIKPEAGYTFLVFLTPDLIVTKWRWSEVDPVRPDYPIDYDTRFGAQLWPPT